MHRLAGGAGAKDGAGDRGRSVEAAADLAEGVLALRTKPVAAVLLPELWRSHCHKCFDSTTSLSRCGRCKTAYYCSRTCQQADWADHKRECKCVAQLTTLRLRSDQVADVLLLGRVMRRQEEKVDGVSAGELVWYQEDMVDQELLLLAGLAQKLKLVDDSFAIEELQRMLSRFRNNNFSICDDLLLEVGAGCFPFGAMINHNCDPNCAVTFVSKTHEIEFRAMTYIKSGQEITQTYVDIALPRRERQQRLQRKYHFICSCSRCSQSTQDLDCLDTFLDADIDGIPQDRWTQERNEDVERALQEMNDARSRGAGISDVTKQKEHYIESLKQLMERQGKILHCNSIALLQTCSALFSAEMERGSVKEAAHYGEQMLDFYRRVYNSNHPMTGLHLFTLGDLYSQMTQTGAEAGGYLTKASQYFSEARRILRITHGQDHRFSQMLTDRLEHVVTP